MAELAERELLVASLRGYLEELLESGVTELNFGGEIAAEATIPAAEVAAPAPTGTCAPEAEGAPLYRGFGNPSARLVFVMAGEGFRGEAGELLAKIVQAMGFARDAVYLLCFDERALPSRASLLAALHKVDPEAVVALGETAARLLLETETPLEQLRGTFCALEGAALMPTWHPEALLKDQTLKRDVWSDMQQVMRRLG